MSVLNVKENTWNEYINQVEAGEEISGGVDGNANIATRQLAENIFFVKRKMYELVQYKDNRLSESQRAEFSEIINKRINNIENIISEYKDLTDSEIDAVTKLIRDDVNVTLEKLDSAVKDNTEKSNELADRIDNEILSTMDGFQDAINTIEASDEAVEEIIRTVLGARYEDGKSPLEMTLSLLLQEETVRAEQDLAQAKRIDILQSSIGGEYEAFKTWKYYEDPEDWIGGIYHPEEYSLKVLNSELTSPSFVIDGSKFNHIKLRIKRIGEPTWKGKLLWNGRSETEFKNIEEPLDWNNSNFITINIDVAEEWRNITVNNIYFQFTDSADASNYFIIDWISIGRNTPGISTAQIATIENTITELDSATAERLTNIEADLVIPGKGYGEGSYKDWVASTIGPDGSHTKQLESLNSKWEGAEGFESVTDIVNNLETKTDATQAAAISNNTITAKFGNLTQDDLVPIIDSYGEYVNKIEIVAGAQEVTAEKLEGLTTEFNDSSTEFNQRLTSNSDEISANNALVTSLTARTAGIEGSIESIEEVIVNDDGTGLAQRIDNLELDIDGEDGINARITELDEIVSENDRTTVQRLDNIELDGEDFKSSITSLESIVDLENENSVITSKFNSIDSKVGEHSGSIDSLERIVDMENEDSVIVTKFNNLNAKTNSAIGSITSLEEVVTTTNNSFVTQINNLNSRTNTTEGSISELQETTNTLTKSITENNRKISSRFNIIEDIEIVPGYSSFPEYYENRWGDILERRVFDNEEDLRNYNPDLNGTDLGKSKEIKKASDLGISGYSGNIYLETSVPSTDELVSEMVTDEDGNVIEPAVYEYQIDLTKDIEQIAYTDDGRIFTRQSNRPDDTWSNWVEILDTSTYSDMIKVAKSILYGTAANTNAVVGVKEKTYADMETAMSEIVTQIESDVDGNTSNIDNIIKTYATKDYVGGEITSEINNKFKTEDGVVTGSIALELKKAWSDDFSSTAEKLENFVADYDGNLADVINSVKAYADNDSAAAESVSTLRTEFDNNKTGVDSSIKSLADENVAQTERMDNLYADIGVNSAAITSEVLARTTEDEAIVKSVNELSTRTDDTESRISKAETAISTNSGAIAQQKTDLTAAYTKAIDDIEIGGRNYFNSSYLSDNSNWEGGSYKSPKNPIKLEPNGTYTLHIKKVDLSTGWGVVHLETGEADAKVRIVHSLYNNSNNPRIYENITETFTVDDTGNLWFNAYGRNITEYWTEPQIFKGTVLQDWAPAPEDTISYIDGEIATVITQVESKADISRVDTVESNAEKALASAKTELTGEYSTAITAAKNESAIDAQTKADAAKKDANDYTLVKFTEADASIKEIKQITNNANQSIVELGQTVESNFTSNNTLVETVKQELVNKIDDIEIGGRNYFALSKDPYYSYVRSIGDGIYTNRSSTSSFALLQLNALSLEVGENYTISFYVRANVEGIEWSNSRLYLNSGNTVYHNKPEMVVDKWVRVVAHFNLDQQYALVHIYISGLQSDGDIDFKDVKVEKGNKVTDWTPAPEDLLNTVETSSIAAREAAITFAKAEAEAKRVLAESYADGIVSAEEQRAIEDANNKLEQAKADATAKADKAKKDAEAAAKTFTTTEVTKANARIDTLSTSINDAKQSLVEQGNTITSNFNSTTTLVESTKKSLDEKIDSIEIGGRNLFRASTLGRYAGGGVNSSSVVTMSGSDINVPSNPGDLIGFKVVDLKGAPNLMISGYTDLTDGFRVYHRFDTTGQVGTSAPIVNGRFEFLLPIPTGATSVNIGIGQYPFVEAYQISELMVETGNKATAWSPAPEDTIDYVDKGLADAKTASEQYASQKANEALTAANSNTVTKASEAQDAAEKYALAKAKAEADAALALAKSDATSKANAAKSAAEAAAALDAKNKADKALADAKIDATAKANAAKEHADTIVNSLKTVVDSKATIEQLNTVKNDANQALASTKTELTGSYTKAIENIEIGGRNYFSYSEIKSSTLKLGSYGLWGVQLEPNSIYTFYCKGMDASPNNAWLRVYEGDYNTVSPYWLWVGQKTKGEFSREITTDESGMLWLSWYGRNPADITEKAQIFKGSVLQDWTPAPEDVTDYVDTSVSNLKTIVDSKASISRVDTIENNANQALATAKTELTSGYTKAVKDAKDELDEKIVSNADIIKTMYTKSDADAAIAAESTKLTSSYTSDITTAVDSIEIGGRNLMLNSQEFSRVLGSRYGGIETTFLGKDKVGYVNAPRTTMNGFNQDYKEDAVQDIPYTFSINVSYVGAKPRQIQLYGFSGSYTDLVGVENLVEGKWIRIHLTRESYSGSFRGNFHIHVRTEGDITSKVYFADAKVEKGNKVTDWTPAPEDITSAIEGTIETIKRVEATADGVKAEASSIITVGDKITGWKNLNTGATSSFDILDDNFSVGNSTTSKKPFKIVGNDIQFNGKVSFNSVTDTEVIDKAVDDINNLVIGGRNYIVAARAGRFIGSATILEKSTAYNIYGNVIDITSDPNDLVGFVVNLQGNEGKMKLSLQSNATSIATYYTFENSPRKNTLLKKTGNLFELDLEVPVGCTRLDIGISQYPYSVPHQLINLKLEKGNMVTDWTPAPEDIELDAYKKTHLPVRYIRDWANGSTSNTSNHWVEIQAYSSGVNVARGKTVTTSGTESALTRIVDGSSTGSYASIGSGYNHVTVDLGKVYHDISEIKIWKYWSDGRTYHKTKTEVSSDGTTWFTIFDSYVEGEYTETSSGKSIIPLISKADSLPLLAAAADRAQVIIDSVSSITADDKITPNEKRELVRLKSEIESTHTELLKSVATVPGASVSSSYTAAYDSITSKITSASSNATIISTITSVDRTALDTALSLYFTERAKLNDLLVSKSKAYAESQANDAKNAAIEDAMIKDTRSDNNPPSWYFTNYGLKTAKEFKYRSVIGLTEGSGTYCYLETKVKWTNSSGGAVVQTAIDDNGESYSRKGTSTTWSDWEKSETSTGAQEKASTALSDAKLYADTKTSDAVKEIIGDNKITPNEKRDLLRVKDEIVSTHTELLKSVNTVPGATTPSTYTSAYSNVTTRLTNAAASPTIITSITATDRNNLTAALSTYFSERAKLNDILVTKSKEYAESQANAAKDAAKVYTDLNDKVVVIDGSTKKFLNPASFNTTSGSLTGYLIIETPITASRMVKLNIGGYNYQEGKSNLDISIGYYFNGSFRRYDYADMGTYPVENVRLGVKNSRSVVIIGNANSTWSYPKIEVIQAIIGHQNPPDDWMGGWNIRISDSIIDITDVVTINNNASTSVKSLQDNIYVPGTTEINGNNIYTGTVTADAINAINLSAISSDLGDITGGSININDNFIVDSSGNLTAKSGTFEGTVLAENIEGTIGIESMKRSAWMGGYKLFIHKSISGAPTSPAGYTSFDRAYYNILPSFGGITWSSGSSGDKNEIGGVMFEIEVFCDNPYTTVFQRAFTVDDYLYVYVNGESVAGMNSSFPDSSAEGQFSFPLIEGLNLIQYCMKSGGGELSLMLLGDFVDNSHVTFY